MPDVTLTAVLREVLDDDLKSYRPSPSMLVVQADPRSGRDATSREIDVKCSQGVCPQPVCIYLRTVLLRVVIVLICSLPLTVLGNKYSIALIPTALARCCSGCPPLDHRLGAVDQPSALLG